MNDGKNSIAFENLVKNHKILLENLFKKGLSPKTESVIEGFSNFFRDTFWNDSDQLGVEVTKSLVVALIECLGVSEYKVVTVASKILRNYINYIGEIPQNCIPKLIEALDTNVQTSAYQVALTLGCIGCSKPDREVIKQIGIIPIHDVDSWVCYNCEGGFMRIENANYVVPSLIKNLNRPISRDKNRKVRWACATALGEIAYSNPNAVLNALQPLHNIIKEEGGRDATIFALGCIGYTRPDLIEDFIQPFERVCKEGYSNLFMACRSALKKIGMETNCILNYTLKGKKELDESMNIFFERMKEYRGRLVSDSIFAIKDLTKKFPDEVINILNKKLDKDSTGSLIDNISMTLDLISEELHYKMKETIPILIEHFKNKGYSYRTMDSSARTLTRIFKNNPKLIPEDLEKILITFLKFEKRASVLDNTRLLLEEIRKHNIRTNKQ